MRSNRRFEVVCNLKELKVIETALGCFESFSNSFYLPPDIDEGFGVSGSRDLGIFEISHHEMKFRAHQEVHALLEMPRISPSMLLTKAFLLAAASAFVLERLKIFQSSSLRRTTFSAGVPFQITIISGMRR